MNIDAVGESASAKERGGFEARLLDAVGQSVIATDLDGTVTFWNRAAEELFGWERGEVLGRSIDEVNVLEENRDEASRVMDAVKAGRTWSGEFTVRRRDGSTFPALVTNSPIRDSSGAVVGVVGVSSDLTERKRLEEALRGAQRMEAVGRLAGGVAHDFNNVLTAIQGYVELLRGRLEEDGEALEDLDGLKEAADRAADLTRQLLAFSRKQIIRPRVLHPGEVLAPLASTLATLTGEGVELELDVGGRASPSLVDPRALEQVIMNLVMNSETAMPRGGTIRISVGDTTVGADDPRLGEGMVPGEYVCVAVADDGEGIAPEIRTRVFEPFFTTREEQGGTGLGLSTVYGIVKQSGGFVYLESEIGKGTVFRIFLPPAGPPRLPEEQPVAPTQAPG